jgi:hypothetical protein
MTVEHPNVGIQLGHLHENCSRKCEYGLCGISSQGIPEPLKMLSHYSMMVMFGQSGHPLIHWKYVSHM